MPYKDSEKAKRQRKKYYIENKKEISKVKSLWSKNNKERSNTIKRKYAIAHPDKRKESWSEYNSSEKGKKKKHEWYRKWADANGVKTWEEWTEIRKQKLGINSYGYPNKFDKELKEKIIKRDNYTCQICNITEALSMILWKRKLSVHHINYDKNDLSEKNLMTVCTRCNAHLNFYREYWKIFNGQKKPLVYVVIPTVREGAIKAFLEIWRDELKDCKIIIVEDNPKATFVLPSDNNIIHLSHEDINNDLKEKSWIISKNTGAICSYGFYKAWKMGADVIIKMDDDLLIRKSGFVQEHIENLFKTRPLHWMNIMSGGFPRGFPYTERTRITVLNYGLADNILDLDASTQILGNNVKLMNESLAAPYGSYVPVCGMNVAFLADIVPAYYFGLQGKIYGLDRFDDIWSGVFLKKITDHLGHVIAIGNPIITHNRLSNPISNLDKESGGMDINEILWQEVDKIRLTKYTYAGCFKELADKLQLPIIDYGDKLKKAMNLWADLFNE